MKKKIVLIILLFLTNSFILLAQVNKADTTASKNGISKTVGANSSPDTTSNGKKTINDKIDKKVDTVSKIAVQKKQPDTTRVVKTASPVSNELKKDTTATTHINKKNIEDTAITANKLKSVTQKAITDTSTSAKISATPISKSTNNPLLLKDTSALQKNIADTTLSVKKHPGKKNKKLADKKLTSDSLSVKIKEKKGKSARELKREAKKNDINNWTEKQLADMAFKQISTDTSIKMTKGPLHTDIPFVNARPFALDEPVNPLDIKFYHRYWRDIDLQDPRNKQLSLHHADLITALLAAIKGKQIKAYNPASVTPDNPSGDAFTVPIPYDQLMSGLSDTSVVNILDKDGNITGTKTVPNPFTPEKIAGYRIKEDVFYDKVRSRTITRIIGIAPLVKLTLSSGEVINVQPLCWLRFKDCRKVFVTIDIDPTKKIGDSMDDVFLQRRFYGQIVQESNPEGKRIKDYKTEIADQEAEAKRIEKKIALFKKGSWDYVMLTPAPKTNPADNKPMATKSKKVKIKAPTDIAKPIDTVKRTETSKPAETIKP